MHFPYRNIPVSISTDFTLVKDPIIYGIEKLNLYSTDDRLDFKINCADPNAEVTCTGDGVTEFPYAMDAGFSDHPSMYFSIEMSKYDTNKVYEITICTRNQYTGDRQTFYISRDSY